MLNRTAILLPHNHPAVLNRRTKWLGQITSPQIGPVLKRGSNSPKVGDRIQKGHLAGAPVYTLTIEERATCPLSCEHWRSCYQNNSHWAWRYEHGPGLEHALEAELPELARKHVGFGFVIRLHIGGDFYSLPDVELWRRALAGYPRMTMVGFTRRYDAGDPIADAVKKRLTIPTGSS